MGETVSCLYSSSTRNTITSDDINTEVRALQDDLEEDDRRMFNFAKREISKEASKRNILNVTIYIDFKHREPLRIKRGNSGEQFIIVTEEEGVFILRWEKIWLTRRICGGFQDITWEAIFKYAGLATSMLAIAYNVKRKVQ